MTGENVGKIILFQQNLHCHFVCEEVYQSGLLSTMRTFFGSKD